jgi:hypothetical protein
MPRKGRGGDWNAKRGQAGVGRWERDIDIEGKGWQAQKGNGMGTVSSIRDNDTYG